MLGPGLIGYPAFIALIAVVGVAGYVAVQTGKTEAIYLFFGLLLLVVIIIPIYSVYRDRQQLRDATRLEPSSLPERARTMDATQTGFARQLSDDQRRIVIQALEKMTVQVAEQLQMPSSDVRANLFEPMASGMLRIIPELTVHMEGSAELTLQIPEGYGSTGRCCRSGAPNIAILHENWGPDVLADAEMRKLHPGLCWIISIPVFLQQGDRSPIGVLNVDGVNRRAEKAELETVLKGLFHWSAFVQIVIVESQKKQGGAS